LRSEVRENVLGSGPLEGGRDKGEDNAKFTVGEVCSAGVRLIELVEGML
jgi:hypothetical protein